MTCGVMRVDRKVFLTDLVDRGLSEVQLAISGAHPGL